MCYARTTLARPLALCLILFPILTAHDLYILPAAFHVKAGQAVTISFHNGDLFPESEVAPPLARLKNARLSSRLGSEPLKDLRVFGKEVLGDVTVPAGASLQAVVTTIPNFIELQPDKFLDYLKEEGLNRVMEWRTGHGEMAKPGRERYSKFAKSLLQSGGDDDYYKEPMGFPIEIIPLANPYKLAAGAKLPVRVLLHGKPAAGLQLEAAWAAHGKSKTTVIGRTGNNGQILVLIDLAGKWRLHTLSMERCADSNAADWESLWASLTFEIR